METKRCPGCHKLLRVDAQICGTCGHNFVQITYVKRKARTHPRPTIQLSDSSQPPASPHGAGHYSGLHPEDQPYLSSFMVAVRPEPDVPQPLALQESGANVFPAQEENDPITPPGLPAHAQQRQAKKTVKLLASLSPSPLPEPQRGAPVSSAPTPQSPEQPQKVAPHYQQMAAYRTAARRKSQFRSHAVPVLLIAACILFLLATSLLAFLLLNGKSPATRPTVLAPARLQLSTATIALGATEPGGVYHKTLVLTNTGEQSVIWQASSDSSWLSITPAGGKLTGNTTISLPVTVNCGVLAAGNYTGRIAFARQGSHTPLTNLTVTMAIKASHVNLALSLASLSFYGSAARNPAGQALTIQNKGSGALDWSSTIATANKGSWLSMSPSRGHLQANASQVVAVSVQSQGMAPGTYQGTISFKGGANPQVTVTLVVASPGTLSVSPTSLALSAVAGQQAAGQGLVVQNSGDQPLNWTAVAATANGGNWLSVTPSQGYLIAHVAASITVNANAAALSPGTYQGTLTFSYAGGSSMQVAVSFTISPLPVPGLSVHPGTLDFSTIMGTNPAPQSFLITDSGTAALDWAISEDANATKYIPLASTHATLYPGKSTTITVQPNVSQAGAGTIAGVLTVYDSDKGSQVPSAQIAITITILDQAQISVSVNSLSFDQSSQVTQSTELLVITNTGSVVLDWALAQSGQSQAPWLSVDSNSGSLGPAEAALVNVTCNSSQLPPGTYTATLEVSDTDPGSPVQPQYITVTLTVSS